MHYAENSPIKPLVVRSEDSEEGYALPQSVAMFRPGLVDAVARYPLLGLAYLASIDQYICITAKRYAVLTPNSIIPLTGRLGASVRCA